MTDIWDMTLVPCHGRLWYRYDNAMPYGPERHAVGQICDVSPKAGDVSMNENNLYTIRLID